MVTGTKVDLAPLDLKYAEQLRAVRNNLAVLELAGSTDYAPVTDEAHQKWIDQKVASGATKYHFAVIEKTSGKAVGDAALFDFDWISRTAALQVRIGPEENWGKGYGTEAVTLLCKYGFEVLDLGRIYLLVAGHNERAIATYEKIGFKKEGVMRRHFFISGEHHDGIMMGLLPEELRT